LVEYRFGPDNFEVRHVRAPGQADVDLDELFANERTKAPGATAPAKTSATI